MWYLCRPDGKRSGGNGCRLRGGSLYAVPIQTIGCCVSALSRSGYRTLRHSMEWRPYSSPPVCAEMAMAALRGYGIRSSSALEEDKLCVAQEAVSSLGLSEGRKERITHRHHL